VNIVAMTMMDSMEHGVMRLVGSGSGKIREVLNQLNLQFSETEVLCVNLPIRRSVCRCNGETVHVTYQYFLCVLHSGRTRRTYHRGAEGGRRQ
jgi:hypothetical protein